MGAYLPTRLQEVQTFSTVFLFIMSPLLLPIVTNLKITRLELWRNNLVISISLSKMQMSLYPAHAKLASQPPEDNHRQEPRSPATATGVTRGQCGAGGSSQAGSSQGRTPFFMSPGAAALSVWDSQKQVRCWKNSERNRRRLGMSDTVSGIF